MYTFHPLRLLKYYEFYEPFGIRREHIRYFVKLVRKINWFNGYVGEIKYVNLFRALPDQLLRSLFSVKIYLVNPLNDQAPAGYDVRPSYVAPETMENRKQILRNGTTVVPARSSGQGENEQPAVAVYAKAYSFENSTDEVGLNYAKAKSVTSFGGYLIVEYSSAAELSYYRYNHSAVAELMSKCSPLKNDLDNVRVLMSWKQANTMQIDPIIADDTLMYAFVRFKTASQNARFCPASILSSQLTKQ